MTKLCSRCDKSVYPTEELKCLDKVNLKKSEEEEERQKNGKFQVLKAMEHSIERSDDLRASNAFLFYSAAIASLFYPLQHFSIKDSQRFSKILTRFSQILGNSRCFSAILAGSESAHVDFDFPQIGRILNESIKNLETKLTSNRKNR